MIKQVMIAVILLAFSTITSASFLPPTPVPFKYGTGVIGNNIIYIGLGSAGKSWFKLDKNMRNGHWESMAVFPGDAREQATSVMLDGRIYVFGGTGKNAQGKTRVFNDVWMYSPSEDHWTKLMTHSPVGLTGHVALVHKGRVIITGGVNQNIFNGYFDDIDSAGGEPELIKKITRNYFNKPIKDYFYNRKIMSFDPSTLQWHSLGEIPYSGTAGSILVPGEDKFLLINGELKPGLRTDTVYRGVFQGGEIKWSYLPTVMSPDGVAGGFGGMSQGRVILAGGAGFKGARSNYDKGQYWAHLGLTKYYSDSIYVYQSGKWSSQGKLPEGLAYGVSLPWKDGMVIIGGETSEGNALSSSLWLGINHSQVMIKD